MVAIPGFFPLELQPEPFALKGVVFFFVVIEVHAFLPLFYSAGFTAYL